MPGHVENLRPEHRQYGDWTSSRIGGGGWIQGVRYTSDPDRLYAWTDVGGAHRSDDGGATWRNITWTLPYGGTTESRGMLYVREVLPDPSDPERVLAAIGYHWSPRFGIYVTDDAGASWRRTLVAWYSGDSETRENGSVLVRDPSDDQRLWTVGLTDGVFRSDDNGETWEHVGGPSVQPSDLVVDRADPDRLWLAAAALTKGATHGRGNQPDGSLRLPAGLWRTTDGGANWEVLVKDREVQRLAQDPNDADRLYAVFDDHTRVERSTDGGRTWSRYDDGLDTGEVPGPYPHAHRYFELVVDRGRVYAISSKGDIYRLDARWNRWTRIGPQTVHEPEGWYNATHDNPTYGTTWVNTMSAVARVSFSPHVEGDMWMTDWFSAYHSTDGGQTWTNRTEGLEVTYIDSFEQDPTDPNFVHMGMADNGYFRSTDAGVSFRGRSTFTPITNNVKSISVPASNPQRVYAVGPNPPGGGWYAGYVFISDDKGINWRASEMKGLPKIGENNHRAHTILSPDDKPDMVFLTVTKAIGPDAGGLYVSLDAGDTWKPFSDGLPEGVDFYRHDAWRGGKELAISSNGTMLTNSIENKRLFRRAKNDTAWQEVPFPASTQINDVRADTHTPGRFYAAATADGFYRSDDDGQTWTRFDTPDEAPGIFQLIVDRVVPDRIAVGTSHGVILSHDGGETWATLDQSLPGRVDWNKGAFAGDRLVVGSGGTGCYWIDVPSRVAGAIGGER
ncbi:MAG: hypothetical protein AAFX76_10185 [Planctomycetota bacterium]